jgi:hypothetical protein
MVADAFTAISLARAGVVTAIAGFEILIGFTFHGFLLSSLCKG